jgi:MFS family permease
MRGRVLALQAMVFLGSTPIGGPIVGWICQQFGARYGLAVGALAALGAGFWGMTTVRKAEVRRLEREQATDSVLDAIAEVGDDLPPELPVGLTA